MRALRLLTSLSTLAGKKRIARVDPLRFRSASNALAHPEVLGARRVAITRAVLCIASMIALHLDGSALAFATLAYASLGCYSAYSAILLRGSLAQQFGVSERLVHWIDVSFCVWLVCVTGGTTSVFFYLFFFSILVASFSYGYREGLTITMVAAASFIVVGVWNNVDNSGPPFDRIFMGAGYVLLYGYMVSYWGGRELLLKRQLRLLQEVNNLWNPRFGVEHAIGINLDRLLDFYAADNCILIAGESAMPRRYLMFSASATMRARASAPLSMSREAVAPFFALPEARALSYARSPGRWLKDDVLCIAYEGDLRIDGGDVLEACKALENVLDSSSFITAPYAQRDGTKGRIYITSKTKKFSVADLEFLLQFAATMSPVVENLQLMDELISKASEHERYKISRDIHDTTIQPYIGLKLGLEALCREQAAGERIDGKLQELIEMTNMTIKDLRAYAAKLRDETPLSGDFLVAAVKEQAKRYKRFYGVEVEINIEIGTRLTGRLAAEVFQIVAEGLSNIVKHTTAKRAFVTVSYESDVLFVKIGNEAPETSSTAPFEPRTIKERAQALGGTVYAEVAVDGYTVIHVNVPLAAQ